MESKYGFIYLTINLINEKMYIGQKKYMSGWKNYLGSGTLLKKSIQKYGSENFRRIVIEECDTREKLDEAERKWIWFFDANSSSEFYNITSGGYNLQTNNNIREYKSGAAHHNSRRVVCVNNGEVFDAIVLASKKYNITGASISECCKNDRRTAGNDPITNTCLVWQYYEDYLIEPKKVDLSRTRNYMVVDENSSSKRKSREVTTCKKVICLEDNKLFNSVRECSEYYNIKISTIRSNITSGKTRNRTLGVRLPNGTRLNFCYEEDYNKKEEK